MNDVSLISRYFPELDDEKLKYFEKFLLLLSGWNQKINLISRKDSGEIYLRHVLHSLSIAKFIQFKAGTHIVDVGTGGGFPGLPLAIVFPDSGFTLVDSIGKKIMAVNNMIEKLELGNVRAIRNRAENINDSFDFAVSRAVAPLDEIYTWIGGKINRPGINSLTNGIICLKGGDLGQELKRLGRPVKIFPVNDYFNEEYFNAKKIVYIPAG